MQHEMCHVLPIPTRRTTTIALFLISRSLSLSLLCCIISERYVKYNIIPRIQNLGSSGVGLRGPFEVVESETICFFRSRADESVWIEDCDGTENIALPSITQHMNYMNVSGSGVLDGRKALVEATLGRSCGEIYNFTRPDSTVAYLDCSSNRNTTSSSLLLDDEEEQGKTLTLAETEAAIQQEGTVFGSMNTASIANDETLGMVAPEQPTTTTTGEVQLDENDTDIITVEEEEPGAVTDDTWSRRSNWMDDNTIRMIHENDDNLVEGGSVE
jgi:hypothetical protein